jgi:hypothetical protein
MASTHNQASPFCLDLKTINLASEVVVYYTPTILHAAGLESRNAVLLATVMVGVAKTSCILVAACVVDRYTLGDGMGLRRSRAHRAAMGRAGKTFPDCCLSVLRVAIWKGCWAHSVV